MANVKFLRGTAAQYTNATKNDSTFYYTTDDKNLYLGETKISNAADLAAAVVKVDKNTGDITTINETLTKLQGTVSDDGSILKMINDVTGTLSNLTTTDRTSLVAAINELKTEIGTNKNAATVEVVKDTTDDTVATKYTIKQGGVALPVTIDIPKDMVVSSAEVRELTSEEITSERPQGKYIVLTIANATSDKVYINVGTLVDIYTATENATQVQIAIDQSTNKISASIVAGGVTATELATNAVTTEKIADNNVTTAKIADKNVTLAKLDDGVQASLGKADSAVQSVTANTDTAEEAKGTILVDDTAVKVNGLGTAAYTDSGAYDTAGSANTVKTDLLGNASTDTADSNTIAGAKKYADQVASNAQLVWGEIEQVTE